MWSHRLTKVIFAALVMIAAMNAQQQKPAPAKPAPAPAAKLATPQRPATPPVAGASAQRIPTRTRPTGPVGHPNIAPHSAPGPTTAHPVPKNPDQRVVVFDRKPHSPNAPGVAAPGHGIPGSPHVIRTPNGAEAHMRAGHPADLRFPARNMAIQRPMIGGRRVEIERRDHSRVVAVRGGRSFVERRYVYSGHEFVRRSILYHGAVYPRYYARHYYHGVYVHYYAPVVYYPPAFYGWAYAPWAAPVPYIWSWNSRPWYSYYGPAFFAPYPLYTAPAFWLTDYLISTSLAAAYEARLADTSVAMQKFEQAGTYGFAPALKDLISEEVRRQISLENSEAAGAPSGSVDPSSSSVQRMLTDNIPHVFVVDRALDLASPTGGACGVSQGDVLQLQGPPSPGSPEALLNVLASKGAPECRRFDTVIVQIADLQEMQNYMRETIDDGLEQLRSGSNRGSLPPLPASALGQPIQASLTAGAPIADTNVPEQIETETKSADQAEKEALAQIQPSLDAEPARVQIGESVSEVIGTFGAPITIAQSATGYIYLYTNLKIIFRDGMVNSIR